MPRMLAKVRSETPKINTRKLTMVTAGKGRAAATGRIPADAKHEQVPEIKRSGGLNLCRNAIGKWLRDRECECPQVKERYGRHVGTRTPDLYRVKALHPRANNERTRENMASCAPSYLLSISRFEPFHL